MRLLVVNHHGMVAGGAEHALLQFLERMPDEIEPQFIFFEDGEFADQMRARFGSVSIVPMSPRISKARRNRLPVTAIGEGFDLIRRLSLALRRAEPDLVLTNTMKAHIAGSIASRIAGFPCVNYVHDSVTGNALRLLKLVSRICAVERMTCSQAVARVLNIAPTTTVYAGIDVEHFTALPSRRDARLLLGLPDDELPVIAIVGRINRWKGHDRFLRIARRILTKNAARFVIVGSPVFGCDPHFLAEVDALIEDDIRDFVHFVPWQRDMRSVYAAIDVSCNCSEREPFGRTSLEALASGVPIVCFNDAGISEIELHGESGVFVEPADEAAFSEAVSSYIRDPERLKRAKAAAPVTAAQLDVRKLERDFLAVIRRNAAPGGEARPTSRSDRVHV